MNTIERVYPATIAPGETTGWQTLQLHIERYRFAARYVSGLTLDIACGVGYGCQILAGAAPAAQVVGVDNAPDALAIARREYSAANIRYICADALEFTWNVPFDTIVSLETLEHLPGPERFLRHLITLARRGGVLVVSVPVTPSVDVNPYHQNDFTRRRLYDLAARYELTVLAALDQVQAYSPARVLLGRERRLTDTRRNLLSYYSRSPAKAWLRLKSILTDGFANKYLTLAVRTPN